MSANKKAMQSELSRMKRYVPVLIGLNAVLGVAFVIVLVIAVSGSGPEHEARTTSQSVHDEGDLLTARANGLIAGLHCPCAGCGHSRFSDCDSKCGERTTVREFVLRHLRSGTDTVTVLAHVKERFGDLTSVAGARKAGQSKYPQSRGSGTLRTDDIEQLETDPFQLQELLEEKPGSSPKNQ